MKKLIQVVCAFAPPLSLPDAAEKVKIKFQAPSHLISTIVAISAAWLFLIIPVPKPRFCKGRKEPLKFCSVKGRFCLCSAAGECKTNRGFWVSDFGNKKIFRAHEKMLTAEKAFFNAGSDVRGAMGKSILPFATKGEVEAFIKEHGGKIVNYSEVNLEL